jgi:hypothetical protein
MKVAFVGSGPTLDHDVLAEVAEHVPTEIARAMWRAGLLPTHVHRPPTLAGTPFADIEVFTQAPTLELVADPDGAVHGRYRQPLVIRDDTIRGELLNTMEMQVPVRVVEQEVEGVTMQMVVIEISAADVRSSNLTPVQDAFFEAAIALETAVAEPAVIPLTPPVPSGIRLFPVLGDYPLSLKVYGNLDGRDSGPTTPAPVLLTHNPFLATPPLPDVAAAVEGEIVLTKIREELIERDLVDGQIVIDRLDEKILDLEVGGEVTWDRDLDIPFFPDGGFTLPLELDLSPRLEAIRLTENIEVGLGNGVIRLTGAIEAVIDDGPDVEADFDLRVAFHFADGKLVPTIMKADVDVDPTIFQVLLAVLFGPVGLVLGPILVGDVALIDNPAVDHPVSLRLDPLQALIRPDAVGVDFALTTAPSPRTRGRPTSAG